METLSVLPLQAPRIDPGASRRRGGGGGGDGGRMQHRGGAGANHGSGLRIGVPAWHPARRWAPCFWNQFQNTLVNNAWCLILTF